MKVALDTNVLLDFALARAPHDKEALALVTLADNRVIQGVLCATSVTTLFYLIERETNRTQARALIEQFTRIFSIAPVDDRVISQALALPFSDFEDAVLHTSVDLAGAQAIVTRNKKDFARAALPIHTPAEFLTIVTLNPKKFRSP